MLAVGTACEPRKIYKRKPDCVLVDFAGKITSRGYVVDPLPTTTNLGLSTASWNVEKSAYDETVLSNQLVYRVRAKNLVTGAIEINSYPLSELDLDVDEPEVRVYSYDGDRPSADLAALVDADRVASTL